MHAVTVRDFRSEDADSADRVLSAAFGRSEVAQLSRELAELPGPGARLVATDAGEVLGLVQLSPAWLDAPARLVDVLVLSPLGVRPDQQGRGIGGQLVRAAIARAGELATPLLFLEGSPQYYPRFGFRPGSELGLIRPSVRIPEPAFQVIEFPNHQQWMTGALVYPDVFWRLDCVGLRDWSEPD